MYVVQKLAEHAETLLRRTGNRIWASVMDGDRQGYQNPLFVRCSQSGASLKYCRAVPRSTCDGPIAPTFASRRFLRCYGKKDVPNVELLEDDDQIWGCVRKHVIAHLKRVMTQTDATTQARAFVNSLKVECYAKAGDSFLSEMLNQSATIAQRLWTSNLPDSTGTALFSYINAAIRTDSEDTAETAAQLARCINQLLVNRRGIKVDRLVKTLTDKECPPKHQSSNPKFDGVIPTGDLDDDEARWCVTFRGGGMAPFARRFFEPGQKYRIPQFFATSFKEGVATGFMRDRGDFEGQKLEALKWYVHVPLGYCDHAALVEKSNMADGDEETPEFEFLFAPFSVFTVQKVRWSAEPSNMRPHEVHIMASPDNAIESNGLPTAPWC